MPKKKTTITKERPSGLFHEMQVRMDIIQKFMKYIESHYVQADETEEANYLMGAALGSIDFINNAMEELRKQEEQNHETI
uniref:hypothetical protein n=1 Tax=uncultured Allisonella sp. TaxID=339338 RepID=UPI002594CFC4|nr:hypothetical protein [uncultured Allisonella sp.]